MLAIEKTNISTMAMISSVIGLFMMILAALLWEHQLFLTFLAFAGTSLAAITSINIRRLQARFDTQAKQLQDNEAQIDTLQNDLLSKTNSLKLARRSQSDFLANMSHELRTPLNAILGFSSLMREEAFGPLGSPYYQEYVNDIIDAGQGLLHIINDILDVSKIETRQLDFVKQDCSIAEIIQSCHSLIDNRSLARGVAIRYDVAPNLPTILGDKLKLKQLLLNLITNSIKFTDPPGTISVQATLSEDGCVVMSVADTGCGVDPEEIPLILSNFGKIEQSYTRTIHHGGAGLGLSIVQGICKLHDADFRFDSVPGKGTEVTITFPAAGIDQMALAQSA